MLSFLDVIILRIILCYHFLVLLFALSFHVIIFGCYLLCYRFVLSFLDVIIVVIICVIILCYHFLLSFPPFFIFVENMTHSHNNGNGKNIFTSCLIAAWLCDIILIKMLFGLLTLPPL
jgi:hypothetical protein